MIFAISIAIIMAIASVMLHFEALVIIDRIARKIVSPRKTLLTIWVGLLTAHVIEIWIFAGAYWLCTELGIGRLVEANTLLDYLYFSAVVYSTLGFGDIVPDQALRMLAGTEALVGLCLIAWSATATYSFSQKHIGRL